MSISIPLNMAQEPTTQAERKDAVANRQRILTAARQLFAEQGPEAVSMSDIVKAVGIGRGTLYRHFPDKGELCLGVMDEEIAAFQNEVLAQLRQKTAVSASTMDKLDAVLKQFVAFIETYAPLLREAQHQGLHYFASGKGVPHYWQQATVLGLLKTAVAHGEIPPDADIEYLSEAIVALLNAHLFHYQRTVRGYSPERISAGLRRFVARLGEQ